MDNNTSNDFFNLFLTTANEHLKKMQQLLFSQDLGNPAVVEELHRHAHSLKGECAAMGFSQTSELSHLLELIFSEMKTGAVVMSPSYSAVLQNALTQLQNSLAQIASTKTEMSVAEFTQKMSQETGVKLPV